MSTIFCLRINDDDEIVDLLSATKRINYSLLVLLIGNLDSYVVLRDVLHCKRGSLCATAIPFVCHTRDLCQNDLTKQKINLRSRGRQLEKSINAYMTSHDRFFKVAVTASQLYFRYVCI